MTDFLRRFIGRQLNSALSEHQNFITLYRYDNGLILFRDSRGSYRSLLTHDITQEPSGIRNTIYYPILPLNVASFLLRMDDDQGLKLVSFEQFGIIQTRVSLILTEEEIIHHYDDVFLPHSLQPVYLQQVYERVNTIAQSILDQMIEESIPWSEYETILERPTVFIVEGTPIPYFLHDGNCNRLDTGEEFDEVPQGDIHDIRFEDIYSEVVAVVISEQAEDISIYSVQVIAMQDGEIIDLGSVVVQAPLGTNSLRFYQVVGTQNDLYNTIRDQVSRGEFDVNELTGPRLPLMATPPALSRLPNIPGHIPGPVTPQTPAPQLRAQTSNSEQITISMIQQSVNRLFAYLYGIPYEDPIVLNGYVRTSFNEISQLLNSHQIVRFDMNLTMQPFAGPIGTQNRVLTFITLDGRRLFTVAQFDPFSNQIFPPSYP